MDIILVGLWLAVCFGGIWLVRREQVKNEKELEVWKRKLLKVNGKDKDPSNH